MIRNLPQCALICLFSLLLISFNSAVHAQDIEPEIITIPFKKKAGPGPFYQAYGKFQGVPRDKSATFYGLHEIAGHLPDKYRGLMIGTLDTDFLQMAYSAIKRGKLDSARFYGGWFGSHSPENTVGVTAEFVDTEVSLAYGLVDGQHVLLVDTDNDERFDDEEVHFLNPEDSVGYYWGDPRIFSAEVDRYVQGEVLRDSVNFTFNPFGEMMLGVNPSQYFESHYMLDGEEKHFYLGNGFYGIRYAKPYLKLIVSDEVFGPDSLNFQRTKFSREILKHEDVFETAESRYVISGVNELGTELYLVKRPKSELWLGTQVGATAPSIEATTLDDRPYSLSKPKLKLLDFWGTWCAPCITEMPYLSDANEFFGGENFELVSIANDSKDRVSTYISKRNIAWTQILQQEGDPILTDYKVSGYPSTFLLGPDNKVIYRNTDLRGYFLIYNLAKQLDISDDQLRRRINKGNVIIELEADDLRVVEIKGEFTNLLSKPLYSIPYTSKTWERGFELKPGKYLIQVNYKTNESFKMKYFQQEIEVTGKSDQRIRLKIK